MAIQRGRPLMREKLPLSRRHPAAGKPLNYPYQEATNAEAFHARFTIQSLIIAVVIAAGLLTLPPVWSVPLIAMACPVVAFVSAQRQLARGSRRLSAIWFSVAAILSNLMYAALCIYPISFVLTGLVIELLFIIPTILSFGCAWATMTTRNSVPAQRALCWPGRRLSSWP